MADFPGSIYVPPSRWWKFTATLLGGGMFFTGGRLPFIEHQRYKILAPVDATTMRVTRELSWEPACDVTNRLNRGIEDGGVMEHING